MERVLCGVLFLQLCRWQGEPWLRRAASAQELVIAQLGRIQTELFRLWRPTAAPRAAVWSCERSTLALELRQRDRLDFVHAVVWHGVPDVLGFLRRSQPPPDRSCGRAAALSVGSRRVRKREDALLDLLPISALISPKLSRLDVLLVDKVQ